MLHFFVTNKTDTVIVTPSGDSIKLKGSGKNRLDGFEAGNSGNYRG